MYLPKDVLNRLKQKKKKLDSFRPLAKSALNRLREQFVIEWTYNSNGIEGNTLTLRETALVLREGITVSGKTLKEHTEATNHKKAIEFVEKFVVSKKSLSEKILLDIHKIVLSDIDDEYAGIYRNQNVRILGARVIPPNPLKIQRLMDEFFKWLDKNTDNLHIIEQVALAHYKLVEIHPFIDGNGRTSRLIMNLLLMQKGYPPAVILKNDRKKYYSTLNEANMGRFEPFVLFIAQSVERSLGLYLETIEPKTKKKQTDLTEYISLMEANKICDYSQEYLSLLARKGKIHAIKRNRNWLTTKESIEDYISNKLKQTP
ncbi:MAG: Fic family protein [bacterium]